MLARGRRGTLVYSFVESVKATFPFYLIRLVGGLLYLAGMLLMTWNVVMTARMGPEAASPRLKADLTAPRAAAA